ncbi:hypothetical protein BG004_002310, partial [Podila humilis]
NFQRVYKINNQNTKRQIQMLLTAAGHPTWDIGVCLTGNTTIRKLNAQYRGKDTATDILSFPFSEPVDVKTPGTLPKPTSDDDKNLGDIYISVRAVKQWCEDNNVKVEDRLPVLCRKRKKGSF